MERRERTRDGVSGTEGAGRQTGGLEEETGREKGHVQEKKRNSNIKKAANFPELVCSSILYKLEIIYFYLQFLRTFLALDSHFTPLAWIQTQL